VFLSPLLRGLLEAVAHRRQMQCFQVLVNAVLI